MSISRRSFLGSLAGGSVALFSGSVRFRRHADSAGTRFAYVASDARFRQGLHVFRIEGQRWQPVQFVASDAPSAMALAPDGRSLFVANCLDQYLGLPTGSVESYTIDPRSGRLRLLSRVGLSLSATSPEHLAVSRDGKQLAVAATRGGSFNVFPVTDTGSLLPARFVRKEIGSGAHPVHQACAHPSCVAFDSRARLLAGDFGADRVSVLDGRDGLLSAVSRMETRPGAGPRSVVLDRTEALVVVAGGLDRSVSAHRYDLTRGILAQNAAYVEGGESTAGVWTSLVAHPQRDLILGSWTDGSKSGIVCWRVDPKTAFLRRRSELVRHGDLRALSVLNVDAHTFVALEGRRGEVTAFRCDPDSGELRWDLTLTEVPSPRAMIVRRSLEDA